ncbi:hypothetical protein JL107_16870 [Nakamurella flavida]|uniref:Uncharacterized protein n=1 Tax=Nakamurella flavida TaxID=363630 RepID=A0A938YRI8_9ACTN|nr:hypothetical protein [Nakamurella flavida]MBM9478122.1 hypothetical protein [Nakamurella flavida]MDP9778656.1 putative membrane protein [Nakamurella flavida]
MGVDNRLWRLRVMLTNDESTRTDLVTSLAICAVFVVLGASLLVQADGFVIGFFGLVLIVINLVGGARDGVLLRRTFAAPSE